MVREKKSRLQVYLDKDDIEYVESIMFFTGIKSRSEAVRFILKMFRLIFPRARYFASIVSRLIEEEEKQER